MVDKEKLLKSAVILADSNAEIGVALGMTRQGVALMIKAGTMLDKHVPAMQEFCKRKRKQRESELKRSA